MRADALAKAREEALREEEEAALAEARARSRAESAAGVEGELEEELIGGLLGELATGEPEPEPEPEPVPDLEPEPEPEPDAEGLEGAARQRSAVSDRLKHLAAVEEQQEEGKNKARWRKTKMPTAMASMFTTAKKEKEEAAAAVWGEKGSAWKRAKKVKLMVEATAAVEEMSADLFMRHKMATLIQSHIRMFLVRARMGMRPGDSLVSESTRQMVQTVLAERRLAEAMAKLSPEAQTAVRKMGTQLANMTKDETFNNAAEHLVSTAHSHSGGHRQGHGEGGFVVLLPSLGCVSRSG